MLKLRPGRYRIKVEFDEGADSENVWIAPRESITVRLHSAKDWFQHFQFYLGFGGPTSPDDDLPWLKNLWQSPDQFKNVDHVGVHLYSKHLDAGYASSMNTLADNDHQKGLWDTEFHWNDLDDNGVHFDDVKAGMVLAMDHFDLGFHSLTWWAFQPRSMGTKAGYIMSDLVHSTVGAATLPTSDMDGGAVSMNKFNSRAFKKSAKEITIWVANYDKGQNDQRTEIANQDIASATYVQWSSSAPIAGVAGNAKIIKKKQGCFDMSFPADTITRVTVLLK